MLHLSLCHYYSLLIRYNYRLCLIIISKIKSAYQHTAAPYTANRVTGKSVSGQGTSVVYVSSTYSKVLVKNVGMSNFVIYSWPIKQPSFFSPLLVNEIGSYKGTKRIKTPGLISIRSQGEWSLNFSK